LSTLYETLGVGPGASKREIVSAFRALALRYHPDRCKDANAKDMFIAVRSAYEILADDLKRAEYDRMLAHRAQRASGVASVPREQPTAAGSYERWQADARRKAEQEAALSYAEFVSTALVSAIKFGGGLVFALGLGALQGALESVLRILAVFAMLVPLAAAILSYATYPALLMITLPLGIGWAILLVRLRGMEKWTWKSSVMFVGGFAAYCGLCVALFSGMVRKNAAERAEGKARFEASISDLRSHFSDYARVFPSAKVKREPPTLGKMVIIDMEARDFHWTFERTLPDDVRPRIHSEVDYVVQTRNFRNLVGNYSRGGAGYQWRCDYALIDLRAGREVFSGSVQGTLPPQSKRHGGDATGSFPLEELVSKWVVKSRSRGTGSANATPAPPR
jgi:DnaJ-domain-containing protein 1